jgi:hypothetical protein
MQDKSIIRSYFFVDLKYRRKKNTRYLSYKLKKLPPVVVVVVCGANVVVAGA